MVELFRENSDVTESTVSKWCLAPEFLAAGGELLMFRCCAVGSVLIEVPVLCRNLSFPKKKPLYSAQALHIASAHVGR